VQRLRPDAGADDHLAGRVIEVLSPGAQTTVQDWPGRIGFWELGVPPSGPMDARSFRIGNRLVGNPQGAAGLEVTLAGPRLRFDVATTIAVTGAPLSVTLDGAAVRPWVAVDVAAGAVLALGTIRGAGMRAYLAVRGGLIGPVAMGSRAMFPAARLGGGALGRGDVLGIAPAPAAGAAAPAAAVARRIPDPPLDVSNHTTLRVVAGPHGAPDFLTDQGLAELFRADWVVHHQSDRTGVRLVGPQPAWARADGGVAGLHPSNILDSAYCVGTVMLAGDMAVIVGPDGPSLGGFAAIGQVIRADMWQIGQLRAGDHVSLPAVDPDQAAVAHARAELEIAGEPAAGRAPTAGGEPSAGRAPTADREPTAGTPAPARRTLPATVFDRPRDGAHGPVTYRRAGECAVLVEFGEPVLDLRSRVRAHGLHERLRAADVSAVDEITPGVRSLHVQYAPERLSTERLIDVLAGLEADSPAPEELVITARTVHLPLAWRHSGALLAMERYQSRVRPDAPWCPDNIEFIRRINGLPDERAVQEIVCAASYLVLGLGDVYLGAPVAVPLDPRHRLVTTKYTPARTWTPANAVGIGGTFLCVYGIEGPGGYQLVGRTVPIWRDTDEPPNLLGHFDQLRFELVDEAELEALREEFVQRSWSPRIEPAEFSLFAHERFVLEHETEIKAFTSRREAAFEAERQAWAAASTSAGPGESAEATG
jgi:urea carboxylase